MAGGGQGGGSVKWLGRVELGVFKGVVCEEGLVLGRLMVLLDEKAGGEGPDEMGGACSSVLVMILRAMWTWSLGSEETRNAPSLNIGLGN